MSKESVHGFARRQRRGAISDWLFGVFVIGVVAILIAGFTSASGFASEHASADSPATNSTPVEVVSEHTALQCGDVPPPTPLRGAAPTC